MIIWFKNYLYNNFLIRGKKEKNLKMVKREIRIRIIFRIQRKHSKVDSEKNEFVNVISSKFKFFKFINPN